MGYELIFRSREDGPAPPIEDLRGFFENRVHYRMNGFIAQYLNEDTGVYFWFDLAGERSPSFHMNYARPHVFALEASNELTSFVNQFDLMVDDEGAAMEFGREWFTREWSGGNRAGYRTASDPSVGYTGWFTRPYARIEQEWRWNYQRAAFQERVGDSVFVPKVSYFVAGGKLVSGAVWSDAISVALPKVDYILLARDRGWASRLLSREPDVIVVPWSEVEQAAASYRFVAGELGHYQLYWDKPPAAIVNFFRDREPSEMLMEGVSADRVLDEETMAEAREACAPRA
jgi:hypothetical protein